MEITSGLRNDHYISRSHDERCLTPADASATIKLSTLQRRIIIVTDAYMPVQVNMLHNRSTESWLNQLQREPPTEIKSLGK